MNRCVIPIDELPPLFEAYPMSLQRLFAVPGASISIELPAAPQQL